MPGHDGFDRVEATRPEQLPDSLVFFGQQRLGIAYDFFQEISRQSGRPG